MKISIFISGRGSNMLKIIENIQNGYLDKVAIHSVYSDNPKAEGLNLARQFNIPSYVMNTGDKKHILPQSEEKRLANILQKEGVFLICLAGFMRIIKKEFLTAFNGRIINIHPSLLPKHPGLHGQQKAIEAGDKESGCTIHLVDKGIDTGKIFAQAKIKIDPKDTVDSLSDRILTKEHFLYSKVLKNISDGLVPDFIDSIKRNEVPN